ncbi:cupin domain-containing protein [bacterium]|nr:cupin domain-containing protein [bacterium]
MSRNRFLALAGALALGACAGHGARPHDTVWTEGVAFAAMGGAEKAEAAYLIGSGSASALYAIRVRIAAGGSIAPHTHPDARILTVVSGEVHYGFGEVVDTRGARLYRPGDTFLVPAGAPHYARAKTSVIYQEAGMAPTATTPVPAGAGPG